ncbi:MAG: hypothetical protein CME32_01125 [Gimesia sp.]|nr:hypothetical protein [Gimesia sp.]
MLISFDYENDSHLKFSYQLLVERYQNADRINTPGSSLTELPSYQDHCEWLRKQTAAEYYLWQQQGKLVAQVFLRSSSSERIDLAIRNEIGVFVLQQHWEAGIGTAAVAALLDKYPNRAIYAKINPDNKRSEKLFKKLGFQNITNIWSVNH